MRFVGYIVTGLLVVLPSFLPSIGASAQQNTQLNSRGGFGHFTVTVTLSEKAMKKLLDSKETVLVTAMFSGHPKKNLRDHYFEDTDPENLGGKDVEILPGGVAVFGEIQLEPDRRNRIDKLDPNLLINVGSGRKSLKDNLLACDDYEGPLRSVTGKNIVVSCKLIQE